VPYALLSITRDFVLSLVQAKINVKRSDYLPPRGYVYHPSISILSTPCWRSVGIIASRNSLGRDSEALLSCSPRNTEGFDAAVHRMENAL
jgi:hypothetical protein